MPALLTTGWCDSDGNGQFLHVIMDPEALVRKEFALTQFGTVLRVGVSVCVRVCVDFSMHILKHSIYILNIACIY